MATLFIIDGALLDSKAIIGTVLSRIEQKLALSFIFIQRNVITYQRLLPLGQPLGRTQAFPDNPPRVRCTYPRYRDVAPNKRLAFRLDLLEAWMRRSNAHLDFGTPGHHIRLVRKYCGYVDRRPMGLEHTWTDWHYACSLLRGRDQHYSLRSGHTYTRTPGLSSFLVPLCTDPRRGIGSLEKPLYHLAPGPWSPLRGL